MAEDIASLGIRITTNGAQQAVSSLSDVERQSRRTERAARDSVSAFDRVSGSLSGVSGAASAFSRVYGVLIGALATSKIIEVADAFTNVASRLNLATGSIEKATIAQQRLFEIAQQTRNSFTATADVFARFATSTQQLGISQDRLFNVTKTLNQAITLSGASAQSAQAAMIQLGQGIAAGTLRGEELNSVLEQTPAVARAIADGLGVPVGALKKLGEQGKLTSEMVIEALEKMAGKIDSDFNKTTATVGQAFTQLGNSAGQLISTVDKATGATGALAKSMSDLSRAIDSVANNPETSAQLKSFGGLMGDFSDRAKLTAGYMLDLFVTIQKLTTLPAFNALFGPTEKSLDGIRTRQAELNQQRQGAGFYERGGIDRELAALKQAEAQALLNQALDLEAVRRDKVTQKAVEQTKAVAAETEEQKKAREQYEKLIAGVRQKLELQKEEIKLGRELTASEKILFDARQKADEMGLTGKRRADFMDLANQQAMMDEIIKRQRDETEALREKEEAAKKASAEFEAMRSKELDASQKSLRSVIEETEKIILQAESIGKSKEEVQQLLIAKEEKRISDLEDLQIIEKLIFGNTELAATYGREIEELKRLKAARQGLAQTEAAQELIEKNKKVATELQKDLERAFTDAFLRGGSLSQAFKLSLKSQVFKVTLEPVFQGVAQFLATEMVKAIALAKASSATFGGDGGGGIDGLLGSGANGKSLYDLFSGGFASIDTQIYNGFARLGNFAGVTGESNIAFANAGSNVVGALGYLAAAKNVFDVSSGGRVGATVGAGVGAYFGGGVGAAIGSSLGKLADELIGLSDALGIEAKVSARALPQEVLTGIADSISKGFTDTVEKLGGTGSLGAVTVTGNTGRQSQNANFTVQSGGFNSADRFKGDGLFLAGEIALNEQNLTDQITRTIFAGLQSSDFADNIDALFDSLDPVTASLEDLTRALGVAEQLVVLNEVFGEFGNNLKALSGASVETIRQFTAAVGGLKNLDGLLRNFNSKFLSAGEQSDLFVAQLTKQFENLSLALPKTRAEFRNLVESQDLLTESGARTYAALLGLTDGVDALFSAAEQAAEASRQAAIESANATLDAANQAVSDAQSALQQAIDAERDRLQVVIDAEEQARDAVRQAYESQRGELDATISKFRDFSSSIRNLRRELSNRAFGGTVGSARSAFNETVSRALGGDEAAFSELGGAANTLLDSLRDSAPDYLTFVRGFADVQRQLLEVEGFADSTASVAEQQLTALQKQVSQFIDLTGKVQSVDRSIKALTDASKQADVARARMVELDNLQLSMLGTINGSVLSVAAAIAGLQSARAQQGTAQNAANIATGNFASVSNDADVQLVQKLYQDIGGRAADPEGLAFYVDQLKSGGKTPQEVVADLVYAKQTLGSKFATGGAFTNGVVTRATQFPMGLMGEAGPEAIMPLTRAPDGSLGVRAAGGQSNAEVVSELRQLRQEVARLRESNEQGDFAIAKATGKTAALLQDWDDGGRVNVRVEATV